MDIEKLRRSIKACAHHPDHDCQSCEYCDNLICYNDEMLADFDKLVDKVSPKPKLFTPEEVQKMEGGTPIVVERFIEHEGKIVPMACWGINTGSLILSFHGTMFPDTVHKIPYSTIVQNQEGRGHHTEIFRFWNTMPPRELMKETPWEISEKEEEGNHV